MPGITFDHGDEDQDYPTVEKMGRRRGGGHDWPAPKRRRAHERDEFKCGHCRAFIGPTVCGGRHRNHCPLCLASRHVDRSRPGDRLSDCGGMMPAVGTFHRANGEQMVLHRCNGCGTERHNRIAADDNPVALLRLPAVPPRHGTRGAERIGAEESVA